MKNIKEILKGIYENIELRKTIVPLFIGNPGISKSVQIREFAKERGVKLVPFVTSQRNPFEISGLAMPDREKKKMSFWDFDTLLDMKDGDILFFDEVFNGNPTVLNACLTILEEREMISGKKLPDIMIVAAANPQGMVPLTPQIKERFIWYKFDFPKEDWQEYMLNKYKMPNIVSNKLCKLINDEDFKDENNYNSARSIDKAVNMLIQGINTPYEDDLLPILETLIENKTKGAVKLSNTRKLEIGESISWLEMIRLNKEIEISEVNNLSIENYEVMLEKSGSEKLRLVKLIKELTNIGLREAKDLVDNAPSLIKTELSKKEANKLANLIIETGSEATVVQIKNENSESKNEILIFNDKDEIIGEIKNIDILKKMYYFDKDAIDDIKSGKKIPASAIPLPRHSFFFKNN